MKITDDMVERGAEALVNAIRNEHGLPPLPFTDRYWNPDRPTWRKRARATLEAALRHSDSE